MDQKAESHVRAGPESKNGKGAQVKKQDLPSEKKK